MPLTAITEDYHQKLDTSFAKANALIERKKVELEGMLKALCEEKDQALLKIDSTFEQHAHTLHRRATLLKNKVIDIYNEHVGNLEHDLEEISTAMTCVVSLKEYHESKISCGEFRNVPSGIEEMEEVFQNIREHITPKENHIIFEERHGIEKYKAGAKDLGRVRCNRPIIIQRSEPEGNENLTDKISLPESPSASNTDISPEPTEPSWGLEPKPTVISPNSSSPDISEVEKIDDVHEAPVKGLDIASSPKRFPPDVSQRPDEEKSAQADADGNNPQVNGNSVDANANKMAVRPKSFNRSPRKMPGSAVIAKPIKGGKSPVTERKELSLPCQPSAEADNTIDDDSPLEGAACIRPKENPVGLINPVLDNLKETDKMYHHLVYTSYDEEELLRELEGGKGKVDLLSMPCRLTDVSDSWTTVSSEESVACDQQSTL